MEETKCLLLQTAPPLQKQMKKRRPSFRCPFKSSKEKTRQRNTGARDRAPGEIQDPKNTTLMQVSEYITLREDAENRIKDTDPLSKALRG